MILRIVSEFILHQYLPSDTWHFLLSSFWLRQNLLDKMLSRVDSYTLVSYPSWYCIWKENLRSFAHFLLFQHLYCTVSWHILFSLSKIIFLPLDLCLLRLRTNIFTVVVITIWVSILEQYLMYMWYVNC